MYRQQNAELAKCMRRWLSVGFQCNMYRPNRNRFFVLRKKINYVIVRFVKQETSVVHLCIKPMAVSVTGTSEE